MSEYKEIVTKAVLGKVKKSFKNKYYVTITEDVDSVLGCFIINHTNGAKLIDGVINITGSFDVNIWYSYNNNSKTNVVTKNIIYEHNVSPNLDKKLFIDNEIIIENLKDPKCTDVNYEGNTINYVIEKELGIEIIGNTKVKIEVFPLEDSYINIEEELTNSEINEIVNEIDSLDDNYLD